MSREYQNWLFGKPVEITTSVPAAMPSPSLCPRCGRIYEWMHEHKCGPMRLEYAVEVLNKIQYRTVDGWEIQEDHVLRDGRCAVSNNPYHYFPEFEAVVIAEALERND